MYPVGDSERVEAHELVQMEPLICAEGNTKMLMERILSRGNLLTALKRMARNKGSYGIDGMPIKDLRRHIVENLNEIVSALRVGTYQLLPVRCVKIPNQCGGVRLLGTAMDCFIQQAIAQVLSPIQHSCESIGAGKPHVVNAEETSRPLRKGSGGSGNQKDIKNNKKTVGQHRFNRICLQPGFPLEMKIKIQLLLINNFTKVKNRERGCVFDIDLGNSSLN